MKILAWPAFKNRKLNPYNYLLYSALERQGCFVDDFGSFKSWFRKYEIFHLHWPEYPLNQWNFKKRLKLEILFLFIKLNKLRKTKIVWTVHNLEPHEKPTENVVEWFYRRWLKCVDGAIYLSESSRNLAYFKYPILSKLPGEVIPIGHYKEVYPDFVSKEQARNFLGLEISNKVILFIGSIRPYKGIESLISCFRALPDPHLRLLIVGRPFYTSYLKELVHLIHGDSRILIIPQYIPDDQMQYYLRAADLMVLPFKNILNSSSAILGLSFELPILTPNIGSMKDLQDIVGTEYVHLYEPPLLPEHLENVLLKVPPSKSPNLDKLDWSIIAQKTKKFYERIIGRD